MLTSIIFVFVATGYVIAESSCHTTDGLYEVNVIDRSVGKKIPQVIAFYAYKTKNVNPGAGRRIVFEKTMTNDGNGYNSHTGVFTCPKTGIYVFIWVIRMFHSEHSTELMINNTLYGATFLRASDGDDATVSGTVVAHVSKGDAVYVRNRPKYGGYGNIYSNEIGKTSFSGWLLQ
ncbi:Hypothetical predicted protein [Mytilus galloprovincialis]|uniref:C1q domain-containing protein n=1 Tax=Mytilus galloprovincialis TaxID=29158 RepID=A0A8B6DJZ6_MYTGA|nr:Hypothetical predicted protein [Mytilus galloprovincialis]